MSQLRSTLTGECIAEFVGTFALILIGNLAVAAAVFHNAHNLTGVAILWGFCVALAICIAGGVTGAHLNPAFTVSFAVVRNFPRRKIVPFIVTQVLGAFAGSARSSPAVEGSGNQEQRSLASPSGNPEAHDDLELLLPEPGCGQHHCRRLR